MPFASFISEGEESDNNGPPSYRAVLKGLPGFTWRLCDDTIGFGGELDPINSSTAGPSTATLQKFIPDTMCIFCTKPGGMSGDMPWSKMVYGSEMISENYGQPASLKTGWSSWHMYSADPSVVQLCFLLKAIAVLFNPNVVAPATVDGF